jgi:polyphosphate kinase 2 (PPK2 family)
MRNDETISVRDPNYIRALEDLKLLTDTRWSPWQFIGADDQDEAAEAALAAVAAAWEKAMPAEPPHLVRAPTQAA